MYSTAGPVFINSSTCLKNHGFQKYPSGFIWNYWLIDCNFISFSRYFMYFRTLMFDQSHWPCFVRIQQVKQDFNMLAHRCNSSQVDISPHTDTLFWLWTNNSSTDFLYGRELVFGLNGGIKARTSCTLGKHAFNQTISQACQPGFLLLWLLANQLKI